MAEKWLNGLVVFFVLAVSTDAARAQEANLWGVDGLTKIMRDAPVPSAPESAALEGARGETVSGQVVFRATRGLKSVGAETTDLKNADHLVSAASVRLQWVRYLYDLDGYLHWGLNYFAAGADPYSEEGVSKDLPLGDRAIMYPGRNGPVGSLRWSAMRDGLLDYELLRVLEARLTSLKQSRGDRADWLDPRQRPLELCRRVATSFCDYTRDSEVLLATRREVASEIEALSRSPLLHVQTEPCEGTAVPAGPRLINVRGIAEPKATVKINGAPVSDVGADGIFAAACFLSRPEITFEAVADGKTRTVTRTFRLVD